MYSLRAAKPLSHRVPAFITFGSPLIEDGGFQQAVSQNPIWSACFLHVVHKDDCFPKIFHLSTMEQSLYKPFGTCLLCSELGSACFKASKSIIELLAPRSP
ncbi:hypothetical protein EUGRSUZ_I01839 [Eucalyptus grandis]|uniref:Uncharacterized protein n=2 Tax=Eucalyptus grandis TaxID=71139 RepID=A0ACC3JGT8_EUCGR|nr:hypothetical protein EUGRSUZ_I01839 [Eucalyptus grandis]